MNSPRPSLETSGIQGHQEDEIFECDGKIDYLYSLNEEIKQLSHEKNQLNKTIETLETESNETELNLLTQIERLKKKT